MSYSGQPSRSRHVATTLTAPELSPRPPPIEAATSEDLLVAAAAGDEVAFTPARRRIRPQTLRVARGVVRDPSIAEEVAQEVLTEVWLKADRFDPERGTVTGWVATLTRRRAVDRVRSEQAGRNRDDRVARRNQVRDVDVVADEVEVRLEHWQVRKALAELSERQREAIELAYFAGHTYRDVARVLGIPEGTAKSRLRDGLLRLREALDGLDLSAGATRLPVSACVARSAH
jgi:RNA polymerase sigma-70 factor, ECF subfamily